MRIDIFAFK